MMYIMNIDNKQSQEHELMKEKIRKYLYSHF